MALILPVNATVDIYRGFNVNQPYPVTGGAGPAVSQIGGHLKHHVRHGRFGSALTLHWTHAFYLPRGSDVRSAYNSQLNTWTPANADTVILADYPIPGWCTAFLVVLVQEAKRGTPGECVVAYLDRMQPVQGSCLQPPSGVTNPCCPSVSIPLTLYATLGTCDDTCYTPQTVTLTYSSVSQEWVGSVTFYNSCRSYNETVTLKLYCVFDGSIGSYTYKLDYQCTLPTGGFAVTTWNWSFPPTSTCSPVNLVFPIVGGVAGCCKTGDGSVYNIIVTQKSLVIGRR
jgi:hypothetical protein